MGDSGTPSASTKPDTPVYPSLPRVPDLTQPPAVCVAWVIAADHEEVIDALLDGDIWSWPAVGELTTGADVTPTPCACYYAGSTWHDGPMVREYHLEQNPDCPLHWAPSWLPPCTCTYRIYTTRIVLPPTQRTRVRPRAWQVVCGTGFTVDPDCRHHGDAAADPAWSIWETRAELVLDEDERRGH